MDWVHCNNCYVQPGDVENRKFFITNCGHIYCDECSKSNQSNACRICHAKYTTIPLTSNMSSEVEVYFHDPVANLKKQVKIFEFQQSHRVRLVSYNRERIRSYKGLKKEIYKLNEELNMCKQENRALREELKRFREKFFEIKKKCESSSNTDQPGSAQKPRVHSFSQFMTSPGMQSKNSYATTRASMGGNFTPNLKRPSNSDFFLMSESKPSSKNERTFTTPDLPRFPGTYRSQKMSTPDMNTPPTPETIIRECSQRDPLQRRVKLPGSRSGPSPATKIGFHGLSLSRPTSTPKKETTPVNKYLKYFN